MWDEQRPNNEPEALQAAEKGSGKGKKGAPMKWFLIAAPIFAVIIISFTVFGPMSNLFRDSQKKIKGNEVAKDEKNKSEKKERKTGIKPTDDMPHLVQLVAAKAAEGITVNKNEKGLYEADYGDGIIMVFIPAGPFTMGPDNSDQWDEKLPFTVNLDGYWIGKYEVTFAQYDKFCTEVGKVKPDDEDWGRGKRPVIDVSWDDANDYCKWLSQKTGLRFKLPTEAQWEKAARGSDGRKYPWGSHEPYYDGKWYANYDANVNWDNSDKRGKDGFVFTAPVGSFPLGESPYGMLDMAGNVWEWCNDWYGPYNAAEQKNPQGSKTGRFRVMRGGCMNYSSWYLRCSHRQYYRPSLRFYDIGFRLCQDS